MGGAFDIHQFLEQLLHAPRRSINVACQAVYLRRRKISVHQHFGSAVDGRQRVAQVVNDGRGQAPDGRDTFLTDQLLPAVLNGRAHRVKCLCEAAQFVAALHWKTVVVMAARNFRSAAV